MWLNFERCSRIKTPHGARRRARKRSPSRPVDIIHTRPLNNQYKWSTLTEPVERWLHGTPINFATSRTCAIIYRRLLLVNISHLNTSAALINILREEKKRRKQIIKAAIIKSSAAISGKITENEF